MIEVRAKRAFLLTLANLARRVSALLGKDVPAATLQAAVCKFMRVLSSLLVARPLAEFEKKIATRNHMSSLGRRLLRLMCKFQQSNETAAKCYGDGKMH